MDRHRCWAVIGGGAIEWWWLVGENEKVVSGVGCLLSVVRFGKERKQGVGFYY